MKSNNKNYVRVLSIKEPFASLIKEKVKFIETRSFKTNYRGKLYIHASKKLIGNSLNGRKDVIKLCENIEYGYGYIICKVNLVDCIYMDEEFIEKIKDDKQEYVCGRYEVGRYAWIFEDIEEITKIPALGKLGIWYFNNDQEVL